MLWGDGEMGRWGDEEDLSKNETCWGERRTRPRELIWRGPTLNKSLSKSETPRSRADVRATAPSGPNRYRCQILGPSHAHSYCKRKKI